MINKIHILTTNELKQNEIAFYHNKVNTYPIHGHVYYEILIYDVFEGEIAVNGEKFDTGIPTAILVTPNDFHGITLRYPQETFCFKIQIARELFEKFSNYTFFSIVTQNHERVSFLRSLCIQCEKNKDDSEYVMKCVELIARTLQKSSGKVSFSGKNVSLIRKATDIIYRRFQEPLTLTQVAGELHVSPQYLSSLFLRYAQMSFIEYLTERRLNYAIVALRNGANVTEACFQSGYRNLSHFIRSFKKKYNVTPSKIKNLTQSTVE